MVFTVVQHDKDGNLIDENYVPKITPEIQAFLDRIWSEDPDYVEGQ